MRLLIKIIVGMVLIVYIMKMLNVYFLIKPCDDNDSCRLLKIKYVDDNMNVYIYNKKYCNASPVNLKDSNTNDDQFSLSDKKCNDFICILITLIVVIGVFNYWITKRICETITMSLSILCIFVFFPDFTLHAVNSNEYKHMVFHENLATGDTKSYTYEPKIINSEFADSHR